MITIIFTVSFGNVKYFLPQRLVGIDNKMPENFLNNQLTNYTKLKSFMLTPHLLFSFSINSKTGVISTGSQIDREARETIKLTVQAQDGGNPSLSSRCSVIVDIIDYNDNDPRVCFVT